MYAARDTGAPICLTVDFKNTVKQHLDCISPLLYLLSEIILMIIHHQLSETLQVHKILQIEQNNAKHPDSLSPTLRAEALESWKRCDYSSSTSPFHLELVAHRCSECGRAGFNALFHRCEFEVTAFTAKWKSGRPKTPPGLWFGAGI